MTGEHWRRRTLLWIQLLWWLLPGLGGNQDPIGSILLGLLLRGGGIFVLGFYIVVRIAATDGKLFFFCSMVLLVVIYFMFLFV